MVSIGFQLPTKIKQKGRPEGRLFRQERSFGLRRDREFPIVGTEQTVSIDEMTVKRTSCDFGFDEWIKTEAVGLDAHNGLNRPACP